MADTQYWRCPGCEGLHDYGGGGRASVCPSCGRFGMLEPVAVLPVSEVETLRALRERVEDDKLFGRVTQLPEDEWLECARVDVVASYRAALRGEGK